MGAWGYKIFENDAAGDWLYEFEENPSKTFLNEALDQVLSEEYLDVDYSSSALAAIEVLAFLLNKPVEDSDEFEELEIASFEGQLNDAFMEKCIRVIDRILSPSNNELYELWSESNDFNNWKGTVVSLRERIIS